MSLEGAIRDAAVALAAAHVERLASAFEPLEGPGSGANLAISRAARGQTVREHARRVCDAWTAPGLSGRSVALALRSAAAAAESVRRLSSVEVTWTGPHADVPVRMTGEVILDIVRSAERSLLFMSYSSSEITQLVEEIHAAHARGVEVTMVFETGADLPYASLKGAARFLEWRREGPGRMHAKAVVADAATALVSSANLSRAAMGSNMELGLVVRGGPVPAWLVEHVAQLVASGDLA